MSEVHFEPVRPVRAYERVVEQVEAAIASGAIKPGDHLPSERELVTQFAVSRSTVREALRVLESHGLVRSRPGDPNGTAVLPMSSTPLRKSMSRLAANHAVALPELLQFRILLEGTSAFLAAELRTEEELATIRSALVDLDRATERDFAAFTHADVQFHDAMAAASHNTLVQICAQVVRGVTLDLIMDKITRAEAPRALMRNWLQLHTNVFEAIRERDSHRAASLMRRDIYDHYSPHLSRSERRLLRRVIEESGTTLGTWSGPEPTRRDPTDGTAGAGATDPPVNPAETP